MRIGQGRWLVVALAAGLIGALAATGAVWSWHTLQPAPADLHDLLHRRLPLSAAEEARLEVKEKAFDARRKAIETRLIAARRRRRFSLTTADDG